MGLRANLPYPKQFALVHGKSILEWTVSRVLSIPEVSGVVVSLPAAEHMVGLPVGRTEIEAMGQASRPVLTVTGGQTRQESVGIALGSVPREAAWIGVHDGARPCFTRELFLQVFSSAKVFGAAICGLTPSDTIKTKKVVPGQDVFPGSPGGSLVDTTLSRETLISVQTPQIFAAHVLRKAYQLAAQGRMPSTDDSQLVERLGHAVVCVPGERRNIKVTYPEDFVWAECVLGDRESDSGTYEVSTATGLGFDVHRLVQGRKCILGGVEIPSEKGLDGHSDADVVAHSVMDAILGGLAMGDIGLWFPPDDPQYEGASSMELLDQLWQRAKRQADLLHLDVTVIAQKPRISPYYEAIRRNLACVLGVELWRISIKATTTERLGAIGREEGIASYAVATLRKGSQEAFAELLRESFGRFGE